MVPTPSVAGHTTSIESQPAGRVHPIFERLELLDERVRKPLQQPAAPAA